MNDCDEMVMLPLINVMYMSLSYLCMYVTPLPNGYVLFQKSMQILSVGLYLVLLNLYREIPLWKKNQFLSKVVMLLPLGFTFTTWVYSEC